MKTMTLNIAAILCLSFAAAAIGQDLEVENVGDVAAKLQPAPQVVNDAVDHCGRVCDLIKRELLQFTTRRELKIRCGRYWVDIRSKLISPSDREIGIWGIDDPAQTPPMRLFHER